MRTYNNIYANIFFWRTYDQKEIDLIEEHDGKPMACEFKWGKKSLKPTRRWKEEYPGSGYEVISPENYFDYVL